MTLPFDHVPPEWVETLSPALQAGIKKLLPWVKQKLFTLGDDGFNNHLMGCARALGQHFNQEELREILTACGDAYTRPVETREIERVIAKAYDDSPPGNLKKWPKFDPELVKDICEKSEVKSVIELMEKFPSEKADIKEILKGLFPHDPLVCFDESPHKCSTKKLSEHLKNDPTKFQFIVPNPMSKPTGLTQEGEESVRCLDNTGPRKYLVIESDKIPMDDQAAVLNYLAEFAPLAMVIRSGGKSLHGWFDCEGQSEGDVYQLMRRGVMLGSDKQMFSKCQLARTPGAIRDNGKRQSVVVYRRFDAHFDKWRIDELPEIEDTQNEEYSEIEQDENSRKDFELIHISEIDFSTKSNDLIEGLLLKGDISVILAAPGVGKSFFTLNLAACIAMGRDWRDREVEQGAVIYACLEGVTGFKRRIHAFRKAGLLTNDCPFYLLETQLDLLNPDHGEKLIEAIEDLVKAIGEPVKLIVVDTLSRSMPGANENAVEDMTKMLATVQRIQTKTAAHAALVHHTGKDKSRGARGHSSLLGAIGTEITLSQDTASKIITATVSKQKDFECAGKFPFKLQVVQLGFDDKGREITSCLVQHLNESEAPQKKKGRPSEHEPEELLELLPVGSIGDWRTAAEEELNIKKNSFFRYKNLLTEGTHFEFEDGKGGIRKCKGLGQPFPNDPLSPKIEDTRDTA
ncbi:MAG: AAA family ATPase [Verrucomicrobia bacterium]|nr:AAA family ATPase [Verrucomicrobiota bacterium]